MRSITPLNFNWYYQTDFKKEYLHRNYDDKLFTLVNIPHTNKEIPLNNFDEKMYQFTSCYRKKINIDKVEANKRYFLMFDGVGHIAEVYVNEEFVGKHIGGYTGFEFDITQMIEDGDNTIVVVVDSKETNNLPPFGGTIDYLTYGGIYREINLIVVEDTHITNVFIKQENILEEPRLKVEVNVNQPNNYDILVSLYDNEGHLKKQEKMPLRDTNNQIDIKLDSIILWDLDNPYLYRCEIQLMRDITIIDNISEYIGFRKAEFRKDGFYLNNKRIKIQGMNRHQSFPYVGYAMPKSVQEKDAEILKKDLGLNLVRTSHYPQSKHFLNACDRLGLLVFEEIPGWQYVGNKEWQKTLIDNLKEMILRDRNHPSIIIWGVRVNESSDYEELYIKTNELAKLLDDSRPTGGVRCFRHSQLIEDVYTYNDFSYCGRDTILQEIENVTEDNVPYLITEYNGHMFPTKRFDNESRRLEHALRHARVINEYKKLERISGGIAWCMADYNTHRDFGSGDRICYHGILDIYRIPKLAASVYMSENRKDPVLDISTNFNIGEYDSSFMDPIYAFTNCDYIKIKRNNDLIGTYYPNKNEFFNMEHPPIRIDLFGDVLVEKEGYSKEVAEKIKKFAYEIASIGGLDKMTNKEKAVLNDDSLINTAWDLFGKYIANWGGKQVNYEILGYMDGKLVKKIAKGSSHDYQLNIKADSNLLKIDETYDATRILIEEISDNDNKVQYGFDPIQIETSDHLEIIGPNLVSLISGKAAFWVKTKGIVGQAFVKVTSSKYGSQTIHLKIEKTKINWD